MRRRGLVLSLILGLLTAALCGSPAFAAQRSQHYVYIEADSNDPAYEAIACGAQAEAKKLGVTLTTAEPTAFTPAAQTPVVNAVTAEHPQGIIISPNDAKAMLSPISAAKAAGIPVVSALNTLEDATPLASQSVDNETAGGKAAADEIAKLAAGKHVDVAVITYKPGASVPADTRWHSFETEIKKYHNVHYVGPQFMDDLNPSSGAQLADGLLSRDPNLFAIDGTFGFAGEGAAAAVHQRRAKTQVITYDSFAAGISDLKQGLLRALIDYDQPAVGAFAMQQVYNAANGKPVQKLHAHGPIVYTKANIDSPKLRPTLDTTACGNSGS